MESGTARTPRSEHLFARISAALAKAKTRIIRFARETRGGATAIVGVTTGLMFLGVTALVIDQAWLVDQRDTLKISSDAGGIAATLKMNDLLDLDPDISDAQLAAALRTVAERHVKINFAHLGRTTFQEVMNTLVVSVDIDRAERTVTVGVQADFGGTLLGKHMGMFNTFGGPQTMRVETDVKSVINPIEVVLAIDTSGSMRRRIDQNWNCGGCPDSRMNIVKTAAKNLVTILGPNAAERIAIGIVPWNNAVRLDATLANEWDSNGWAVYPETVVYANPYVCTPIDACTPPAAVEETIADPAPEPWNGCMNSHRTGPGARQADIETNTDFFNLPVRKPFAQAFFPSIVGTRYHCLTPPLPTDLGLESCYNGPRYWRNSKGEVLSGNYVEAPQGGCKTTTPTMLQLSTDPAQIEATINLLIPVGASKTYSAMGLLWGQRLLHSEWNTVWGGGIHPANPAQGDNVGIRKALVLLTDGQDTQCGLSNPTCAGSDVGIPREQACAAVKDEGTEIFVVAAMHTDQVSGALGTALRACSSEDDNPQGSYVFINNSSADDLENAFAEIATQLRSVRRTQ